MIKALFYPRQVKFYIDNATASVTNTMSAFRAPLFWQVLTKGSWTGDIDCIHGCKGRN